RHDLRRAVDETSRADDAGGWPRMAPRDLAAFERRLRGGEKSVAAHRNRCRSGMRRLSDEPEHVALHAECAEDDAGRFAERLEDRPLLDVELQVRACVDRAERALRVE